MIKKIKINILEIVFKHRIAATYFVYPAGKPMIPHLLRYQGLAVDDYGFALDASNLGHPRLSLI